MKQNTCVSYYVPVDKETSECVLIPAENYFPYRPLIEHTVVTMASAEKKSCYFVHLPKTLSAKSEQVGFICATGKTYQTVGQSTRDIGFFELKFLFHVFHREVL